MIMNGSFGSQALRSALRGSCPLPQTRPTRGRARAIIADIAAVVRITTTWCTTATSAAAASAIVLHRHPLAAPRRAVDRDEHLGLGGVQPRGERLRPVAGEGRHADRADLGAGHQRYRRLGDHGHEEADAVAFANAEAQQAARNALDLGAELAKGDLPTRAAVAFVDDRRARRQSRGAAACRSTQWVATLSRPPLNQRGNSWPPEASIETGPGRAKR